MTLLEVEAEGDKKDDKDKSDDEKVRAKPTDRSGVVHAVASLRGCGRCC